VKYLRMGVLALWAWGTVPQALADPLIGRASVIDGDTLDDQGVRVRLHGIDAPEASQLCTRTSGEYWRCGAAAANALADRIGQATVNCLGQGRDRYRRTIAVCTLRGEDLGQWLVASGWAIAEQRYSQAYVAEEAQAQRFRRGIWAGDFDPPRDWRRTHRGG
jgi:endonuclease YncB( thermonuclease family)